MGYFRPAYSAGIWLFPENNKKILVKKNGDFFFIFFQTFYTAFKFIGPLNITMASQTCSIPVWQPRTSPERVGGDCQLIRVTREQVLIGRLALFLFNWGINRRRNWVSYLFFFYY